MSQAQDRKIALLQKIKEEKSILFGAFSDKLTKAEKERKLVEVTNVAESLGIVQNKPWTYVRDTVWGNWRKRTMAEKDNAKATGGGGGPASKLTEIDSLVLDILGEDNPVVVGLGREDSLGSTGTGSGSQSVEVSLKSVKETQEDIEQVKAKKLKLQTEHLDLQNYKLRLEILDLERKLGLLPSPYTENLPHLQRQSSVIAHCPSTSQNTLQQPLTLSLFTDSEELPSHSQLYQ